MPRPAGICYDAARQRLFAVSGEQVAVINPATGVVAPFIAQGLEYPFGLALDHDGNLFVSARGRQMQVRVFSPAGKFLRAIGKAGGAARGKGNTTRRGCSCPAASAWMRMASSG